MAGRSACADPGGTLAFATGRDEECVDIAATLVADARTRGMIFALPGGLGHLSEVQTLLGEDRAALVRGTEPADRAGHRAAAVGQLRQ